MTSEQGTVLIVGAGVAGVRAALELAQTGHKVCLIDTAPNIGGTLSQLDNQFPTNHCGMCKILPTMGRSRVAEFCLRRDLNHPNITLMPLTELTSLEGEPGNLQATLRTRSRGVDPARCTACGVCVEVCPVEIPDPFNGTSAKRKAIGIRYPLAIPNVYSIDTQACTKCGKCVEKCPTRAISITGFQPVPKTDQCRDRKEAVVNRSSAGYASLTVGALIPSTSAVGAEHASALPAGVNEVREVETAADRVTHGSPPLKKGGQGGDLSGDQQRAGKKSPLAPLCERGEGRRDEAPTVPPAGEDSSVTTLPVGAVILSTGFDEFDPTPLGQFGYGRFPNVVTSIEFERLLSGMGPTGGELLRPSDRKPVKSIAFLQCVGSRERKRDFCSSACCMYAMKEAMLAKDLDSTVQATIFFMDMRAFGREYHRYYERAKKEFGVEFVRCRVSRVKQRAGTKNLEVTAFAFPPFSAAADPPEADAKGGETGFPISEKPLQPNDANAPVQPQTGEPAPGVEAGRARLLPSRSEEPQAEQPAPSIDAARPALSAADGGITRREFDLVVLSVGQTPSKGSAKLLETLGVKTNEWGFCKTSEFSPVSTSRSGVFVCGSLAGPKDIRDSMTEACAAAAEASFVVSHEGRSRSGVPLEESHEARRGSAGASPSPPNGSQAAVSGETRVTTPTAAAKQKIGVFLCGCGGEISRKIDTREFVAWAQRQRDVRYAAEVDYLCFEDQLRGMVEAARSRELDRIAVAACVPYGFKAKFENALSGAGVQPEFVRVVNVREHVAWVHEDKAAATAKAKSLLGAAIELLRLETTSTGSFELLKQGVLVIGGGLSGLACASAIARYGLDVHLVEKGKSLGGNACDIRHTLETPDAVEIVARLRSDVESSERVHIHLESELTAIAGYVGSFVSKVRMRGEPEVAVQHSPDMSLRAAAKQSPTPPHSRDKEIASLRLAMTEKGDSEHLQPEVIIEHGALVVATGGHEHVTSAYLFGKDERVVTQHAFEKMLFEPGFEKRDVKTVVMIQCVESRDEDKPYCSRICCSQALKNARRLKELKPDADVFILNRDVMAYGFREQWYTKARENGITFVRYEPENKPAVSISEGNVTVQAPYSPLSKGARGLSSHSLAQDVNTPLSPLDRGEWHPPERLRGKLRVSVNDPHLGAELAFEPDLLVLSTGIEPNDARDIARTLGVELDRDGFFTEAEAKFRPQDFLKDGMFVCGLAAGPCGIREALTQAGSVAQRVMAALAQGKTHPARMISEVSERRCAGCEMCIAMCPYSARVKDPRKRIARVIEALCQGCGVCAMVCPSGATKLRGLTEKQVFAMLDAVLV